MILCYIFYHMILHFILCIHQYFGFEHLQQRKVQNNWSLFFDFCPSKLRHLKRDSKRFIGVETGKVPRGANKIPLHDIFVVSVIKGDKSDLVTKTFCQIHFSHFFCRSDLLCLNAGYFSEGVLPTLLQCLGAYSHRSLSSRSIFLAIGPLSLGVFKL